MPSTVQLFITCIADTFFPSVGQAAERVLGRLGVKVAFPPGQTCCGQPAFNAGMRPQARRMAEHTLEVLEHEPGPVVVPSGSCAAMIRHGYPELFAQDRRWLPRAQALVDRTHEFSQFVVDVLGATDVGASFPGRLTYHPACHLLRELGVAGQPAALLARVRAAELVELPNAEDCCGFGGLFSVEHPEISEAMLQRKMDAIQASGADTVVTCDAGCLMHIYGGLQHAGKRQRIVHLAEVLAQE